jgi:UDP-N-acetylglucosamine 2-epimerase (non-hydrolysing)
MKMAPLIKEMNRYEDFESKLVHTGQHYSPAMSQLFFEELGLPPPDFYLGVGSGNHGEQTGKIMIEFEKILLEEKPDFVIVVGDVNSTLACALAAVKQGAKVAHVEAGLRSFDRAMPEEINRVLTDQISDLLFTTEAGAERNLAREGIAASKIHFVGNLMIDALFQHLQKASQSPIRSKLHLDDDEFCLLTLHRPSNVDDERPLRNILFALNEIQKRLRIVFPIHPRTQKNLEQLGLAKMLKEMPNLLVTEALGYLDFIHFLAHAQFVLTDSGGIQEETTALGIPCLTLRENTERPITVEQGTNQIVGSDPEKIMQEAERIISGNFKTGRRPELWDGHAARRIVEVFLKTV